MVPEKRTTESATMATGWLPAMAMRDGADVTIAPMQNSAVPFDVSVPVATGLPSSVKTGGVCEVSIT